jgi:hypothetical protein
MPGARGPTRRRCCPRAGSRRLRRRAGDARLEPVAGEAQTRLAQPDVEVDEDLEAQPSTAEQAVPWLIGFILLLAGMVIVLLALIFAGDDSLGAGGASPSPSNVAAVVSASPDPTPSVRPATPTPASAPSGTPAPTPTPLPEFGPLEMVYQGRATALAPIYLLRHDFTVEEEPATMAQDPSLDVRRFAWAPDGKAGVGLYADVLVSIEPGVEKRRLGDGITTITFGDDGSVVYAVRVTEDGANDVANVLAIDFASGETTELAAITYARPDIAAEAALQEAQFADEGGAIRLYWMEDDALRLWALGAGSWTIDPDDGAVEEREEAPPVLWGPGGERRIARQRGGGDLQPRAARRRRQHRRVDGGRGPRQPSPLVAGRGARGLHARSIGRGRRRAPGPLPVGPRRRGGSHPADEHRGRLRGRVARLHVPVARMRIPCRRS